MPAAVLLGGDPPWLRRLHGISVALRVGSIFNAAVRDNTANQCIGIAARRTTQLDANNHRRYLVTRKSLDAARCTGEPLPVIAKNRVFLCILQCCMAFGRLFVAVLAAGHLFCAPPCGVPGLAPYFCERIQGAKCVCEKWALHT